ncbi:hypothetical protein LEMLEM_LOCUS5795 [Lemmus lemmus]
MVLWPTKNVSTHTVYAIHAVICTSVKLLKSCNPTTSNQVNVHLTVPLIL